MAQVRVGLALPRRVGDEVWSPSPPSHREMLLYGQRAEELGFDSVWVPDHFYFEWPAGLFEPYPEAWTLLTAIGVTTRRVQVGTLVLAAAFRHPALLARMAAALQELTRGRLLLGLGAGNQRAEHTAFGVGFEGRVARFAEYLTVLHGLLSGQPVTFDGRYYSLREASLLVPQPTVPIWVAAAGPRMLSLAGRFANGWNGGANLAGDGAQLEAGPRRSGRDWATRRARAARSGRAARARRSRPALHRLHR
jgi:alkanesulfonate monooxygenase SsuD/methylene tetrahydromethanopterin reductase-like flavin-dependent oxidoreductase (luciferase family)